MIVRAVQSIPKGEQIRNFYSERPDDEYLLDYGFCMKPGENRESYLKFQKDDIARSLRKYFKISSQTIKENMFKTDELTFFLCYENGIIPQLEDLIGNILEQRDDQSLESSFNTTETVEIETLNFLCHFCSQRRRELDRLDQDFAKAKRFGNHYYSVIQFFNLFSDFAMVAKSLRDVHRHIINTSINRFNERLRQLILKKSNTEKNI